jgi:photosystem II stability/assembly factor-like uncharacterized protein
VGFVAAKYVRQTLVWSSIAFALWLAALPLSQRRHFDRHREQRGPFPSDWFMLQRTWPDEKINVDDYRAAWRAADALKTRHALDDQPPWIPVGPTNIGGRVADIVGHPSNSNIFYIAAASGGIFKTVDGGATWQAIFDHATGLSMGALAMDVQHPDTIYAGTGEACSAGYSYFGSGIYRTTDGGASWAHIGLDDSRYIARVVVETENPQSVWVAAMGELFGPGGQRGVFHSTDGGASWNQSLFVNDSTGASDVVVHPTNPQIVFAAMWQRYRTPNVRQAGGMGSGVFRSTDGGATWQRLTNGLPARAANIGRIGLAISESNPNVMYAIYADDPGNFRGVYRSSDAGETWNRTNDGTLNNLYSNFGWYFGNIRVRPDNPNIVFVLGVTLYRTTDGGQSWQGVGSQVHVDHHALWFLPAQPYQILLGNDGGVYRSINNGNSWSFLPGLPINQFYAAAVDARSAVHRMGGTQDNGTLLTEGGGLGDWSNVFGGDGFYCQINPTNSNILYAESQYGYLGRSTDGGQSFFSILDGIDPAERTNWSTPVVIAPGDPHMLYYGAQRLYRTSNGGATWSAISPDLTGGGVGGNLVFGTITTIAASPVNSTVIYVGTDDAHVWGSQNDGASWTDCSNGLPQRWITQVVPDVAADSVVYVCVSGYRNAEQDAHVFRSMNFGATWQSISGDLPSGPVNDLVVDPQRQGRLYAATDLGAYMTDDLGVHWMELGTDLPRVPVIDLVLHEATQQLFAATYGRSMFSLDLTRLTVHDQRSAPNVSASYFLLRSYPNPFNAATSIEFTLPRDGKATMYVYDMIGRSVTTLFDGPQKRGTSRVLWTPEHLPSGNYFVRLTQGNEFQTIKITLLR